VNLGHLAFARAFLEWAHRWRLVTHQEFNRLMGNVRIKEGRVFGCHGKESFLTFKMAHKVAKRHARHGTPRTAYHCHACEMFHVGTRAPKLLDRRRMDTEGMVSDG
jgi:hypothetical protein